MRLSVVIVTHRRADALALALAGLARQRSPPDEVVVSEDGEDPDTAAAVRQAAAAFPCRLAHLREPALGPRRNRTRNRGLAAATGDYLVLLDGDMVPTPWFVHDHRAFARRGSFATGSRVTATAAGTARLLARWETAPGLLAPGLTRRRYLLRLAPLRALLARPRTDTRGVKSCNFGFWREDLVRLNGFDEAMTAWGREDGELAHRALHAGLTRRELRFGAVAIHLWHPSSQPPGDNPNDAIEAATVARRLIRCERGLDAHLPLRPPPDLRPARPGASAAPEAG